MACKKYNPKNNEDVGKKLVKAINEYDTAFIRSIDWINIESLRNDFFDEIVKYKGKNPKFLKVDTNSYYVDGSRNLHVKAYFKIDTSYFYLSYTSTNFGPDDNITIDTYYIMAISDDCSNYIKNPYKPEYAVTFNKFLFNLDYSNSIFKNGKVELQNKSENDIDQIKFRLILKYDFETIFNQTVLSNNKIFAGDIATVDVPGINNFYAGQSLNKYNLKFEATILEVLPKPASDDCLEVNKLKLLGY